MADKCPECGNVGDQQNTLGVTLRSENMDGSLPGVVCLNCGTTCVDIEGTGRVEWNPNDYHVF